MPVVMHETPPLRVSRPVSACARCRSAKIRCDGKLPACTACERANKASGCSSGNDQFARGKERSYVASLETKLEKLQRQVDLHKNRNHSASASGRRQSLREIYGEPHLSKRAEASDLHDLVSDFGALSVNATSSGYRGFDKEMSVSRLVLSVAIIKDLPDVPDLPLPPKNVALDLLQACMAEFFTLCPVMPSAAASGALERAYHQSQRLASPQDRWNVRLILALGLLARSKSRNDAHYESAVRHVTVAMNSVSQFVIASGSLQRLESLLLLVLYSMVDPAHFDSWYLVGMASRFLVEMGLHVTLGIQDDIQPDKIESRRRLFQLVYTLDRFISFSRLQPLSFSDDSADLEMPATLTPADLLAHQSLGMADGDDVAKAFAQLIQAQSSWYYALFYADAEAVVRPWTARLTALHENFSWISKVPRLAEGSIRQRFLLQINYFAVLLVLPSNESVAMASTYAKAVALEAIAHYISDMEQLFSADETTGPSRIDDFLRNLLLGQRLLALCRDPESAIYIGAVPDEEELSQTVALPQLQWAGKGPNADRASTMIRRLDTLLATLSARYDRNPSYRTWKLESEGVLQLLYNPAQHHMATQWQ